MASRAGAWTPIRTLTSQTGEAVAAPAAATLVPLAGLPNPYDVPRLVEFTFQGITATGTPDAVVFSIWRLTTGPAGNVIDLVGQSSVPFANLAIAPPVLLEAYGSTFYVTASFVNGTSPTVSGSVYARGCD